MRIGFIGLGNVGGKLAGSLLRNGMDLAVRYDSRMVFAPIRYLNENKIADLWMQLDATSYPGVDALLQRLSGSTTRPGGSE